MIALTTAAPSFSFTTNEMFSSELPCAIMRMFMPFLATVLKIFEATPNVPFMLAPINRDNGNIVFCRDFAN